MLAYQIRIALKSLRRNPALSALVICGIGLGIAVSTAFITTYYLMAGDPIPHKSDQLFFVEIDAWDPAYPFDEEHPEQATESALLIATRAASLESEIPTYQSAMFKSSLTIQPEGDDERPYRARARLCFSGFLPHVRGALRIRRPLGSERRRQHRTGRSDRQGDQSATLRRSGQRRASGSRSTTATSRSSVSSVTGDPMSSSTISTTIRSRRPKRSSSPSIFSSPMEIASTGNTIRTGRPTFKTPTRTSWSLSPSGSRCGLNCIRRRQTAQEYSAFLDAYAEEQKKLGRHGRPVNNVLLSVTDYMVAEEVVQDEAKILLIISILFLGRLFRQPHRNTAGEVPRPGAGGRAFAEPWARVGSRSSCNTSSNVRSLASSEVLSGSVSHGSLWSSSTACSTTAVAFHLDLTMVLAAFMPLARSPG